MSKTKQFLLSNDTGYTYDSNDDYMDDEYYYNKWIKEHYGSVWKDETIWIPERDGRTLEDMENDNKEESN